MKIQIKAHGAKVRMTVGDRTVALTPEAAVKLSKALVDEAVEIRTGRLDWKAIADRLDGLMRELGLR